jgi:hypothetical protein
MMTEFTPYIAIMLSLLSFSFYCGLYMNLIRTNKENMEKMAATTKDSINSISKQVYESNVSLAKDIGDLTKAVHSLVVSVATLDVRQTHLEKTHMGK